MRTTITAAIAATAGVALLLAGCSTDQSDSTATQSTSVAASPTVESQGAFNNADVTFLREMYPHHAQAIDMADMVPGRTENADIVALAAAIAAAQQPEMEQMAMWLQQSGEPHPASSMQEHIPHGNISGMMSRDQMDGLEGMSGTEFDRMWLTMMIEHHRGAIDMANTELAEGENPEVMRLATNIVAEQQREIADMQAMLG
ncbi:DUF305 domain-containing protein [Rhodococcus sp. WMMA185]|uniref:DUF305 domain-containing protein n=1 Tax=Rhodococcus sp. WMMA185 TaxID=679318 RepID=UPI000877F69C|nr:DUF305 domain-containing protein [Rhodococcus sp. WMMA185]AOW91821.1 DUF305 domain-containing protein [Rhodococcus sp. WMMA185]